MDTKSQIGESIMSLQSLRANYMSYGTHEFHKIVLGTFGAC
jgi:hypothetical protein